MKKYKMIDNLHKRVYKISSALVVVVLFIPFCNIAFSQDTAVDSNKSVIVKPGKLGTGSDSLLLKQLFYSGLREKTVDNLTSAGEFFERVIQLDPKNAPALYELANIKKKKNNYPDAQLFLEKAVRIDKDNKWYWIALADCYEKAAEYAKLQNVFDQLIRISPDNPDYYFDKANADFFLAKYDDALNVFDKLEQITGPSDELLANRQKIYLKQGKINLAANQLEKAIEANPSQIKYYLYLSELYNSNNLIDKAVKVLQTAEKIDANNGLIHLALADIYRDKKNEAESFNELTLAFAIPDENIDQKIKIILGYLPRFPDPNAKASATELSRILAATYPDDAKALAVYGDMLMQNNQLNEAKTFYKKSVALNNQVYAVQEQLVRIELGENETDEAIADGENALSFFPNQAWMNYLVGAAWFQKKDFKKAIDYIKNATQLGFDDKDLLSQSFSALGDCYHGLKDNKLSDDAYDKSLSNNPDNVYTLNNYAYYLSLRAEQLDKAASMSKHANDLQPNTASFEDTYAWILFKQKDYAGAKLWMEKALADDKDNSAVKSEHYGDIMFYLGNVDAAVENWKKAQLNGDRSPVLERKINERKYSE